MMMSEELRKRTSGQKQVFGFEGCERKGQQRLDKIRADHDSEGANTKSLGAAAQRKHRDRGSGSQRPSGSLKIASMRAKEDVHQDDHAESERPRLTNQITTCAVVCLATDVL